MTDTTEPTLIEQSQTFAANMADVYETSQKIWLCSMSVGSVVSVMLPPLCAFPDL
ncbi:MAG: hypothetical protein AAGI50_07870 [Pseudomonadota bacterium]